MTKAPATTMYASVVSRDTVTIALIIAALVDLEVKSGDNLNIYIQTPVTEKVWIISGPAFDKGARKTAVVVGALYGLKLAKAAFRSCLAKCMESLGFMAKIKN